SADHAIMRTIGREYGALQPASGQVRTIGRRRDPDRQLGVTARPYPALFHDGPRGRIGDQSGEHGVIESVAATHRPVGAEDRRAREREVADGVERLVTHELVREAETLGIEAAVLADHERVLERGAQRVTRPPQLADVAQEPEGAGARDLAPEGRGTDLERQRLPADQRMVELDLDLDVEPAVIRFELAVGIA